MTAVEVELLELAGQHFVQVLLEGLLLRGITNEPPARPGKIEYGVGPLGTPERPFAIVRRPRGREIIDLEPCDYVKNLLANGVFGEARFSTPAR